MSEEQNSFALRHQARRAALLADLLREYWDALGWEWDGIDPFDLPSAAARMSDEGWAHASERVALRTGKPFHPPSDTTKAITIGLLSAPQLKGLVG